MKKKVKGSRPWSRVLATQALYQLSLNKNIDISMVKKNLLKDKETRNVPDKRFFSKLVNETIKNKKELDKKLEDAVRKKNFSKMETIIKVILELGVCEIIYFKNLYLNSFNNNKSFGVIHSYYFSSKLSSSNN